MRAKADPATGLFITSWGAAAHFSTTEFLCHCGRCDFDEVSQSLIDRLETIRTRINTPIVVISGIRCPAHNRAKGGAKFSKHLPDADGIGHAADIMCKSLKPPVLYHMYREAFGAGGSGLYWAWLHVDDRAERMEWVNDGRGSQFAVAEFLRDNPGGVTA